MNTREEVSNEYDVDESLSGCLAAVPGADLSSPQPYLDTGIGLPAECNPTLFVRFGFP